MSIKSKVFMLSVVIFSAIASFIISQHKEDPEAVVRSNTVQIKSLNGNTICTGVIVKGEKKTYIITAAHCGNVAHNNKMLVGKQGSPWSSFQEIIKEHPGADLLLLSTDNLDKHLVSEGVSIAKSVPMYTKVFNIGHIFGRAASRFDGEVLDIKPSVSRVFFIDSKEKLMECEANPKYHVYIDPQNEEFLCMTRNILQAATNRTSGGGSGGPLSNYNGELVGITVSTDQVYSYYATLSQINELMKGL